MSSHDSASANPQKLTNWITLITLVVCGVTVAKAIRQDLEKDGTEAFSSVSASADPAVSEQSHRQPRVRKVNLSSTTERLRKLSAKKESTIEERVALLSNEMTERESSEYDTPLDHYETSEDGGSETAEESVNDIEQGNGSAEATEKARQGDTAYTEDEHSHDLLTGSESSQASDNLEEPEDKVESDTSVEEHDWQPTDRAELRDTSSETESSESEEANQELSQLFDDGSSQATADEPEELQEVDREDSQEEEFEAAKVSAETEHESDAIGQENELDQQEQTVERETVKQPEGDEVADETPQQKFVVTYAGPQELSISLRINGKDYLLNSQTSVNLAGQQPWKFQFIRDGQPWTQVSNLPSGNYVITKRQGRWHLRVAPPASTTAE